MHNIANIGFQREDAPEGKQWRTIGRVSYDAKSHRCDLIMYAFRLGMLIAKPFESEAESAPYLSGDIYVSTGTYEMHGVNRKHYQWLGHICTNAETNETRYVIILEAIPVCAITPQSRRVMFLRVSLEDRERKHPSVKPDTDDIPF